MIRIRELRKEKNLSQKDLATQFHVAQNTISDEKDIKPIMFSYLFKIKLKKKYVCKERTKKSSSNVP